MGGEVNPLKAWLALRGDKVISGLPNTVFSGVDIVISQHLAATRTETKTQTRFPRSRRKRIRKKWASNPKNWTTHVTTTPKMGPFMVGNRIICCPEDYVAITSTIRGQL